MAYENIEFFQKCFGCYERITREEAVDIGTIVVKPKQGRREEFYVHKREECIRKAGEKLKSFLGEDGFDVLEKISIR